MGIPKGARCFIYFMRPVGMAGPIKIGCTMHPDHRLHQTMLWSPFPLEIVMMFQGTQDDETALHRRFADLRSHHEWFRADPRIDAAIAELRAKYGSLSLTRGSPRRCAA